MGLFFLPIVEGRATAAGPGPWNSAAIGPRLNVKAPVDPPPPPPLPLTKAGDMSLIQSICQFLPSRHNGYKKEKKHVCKKDAGYYSIWWWSCCCHTPFLSHPSYTIYHPLGHYFTWYSHIVSFFFSSAVWSIRTGSPTVLFGSMIRESLEKKKNIQKNYKKGVSTFPSQFLILSKRVLFFLRWVEKRVASYNLLAMFEYFFIKNLPWWHSRFVERTLPKSYLMAVKDPSKKHHQFLLLFVGSLGSFSEWEVVGIFVNYWREL